MQRPDLPQIMRSAGLAVRTQYQDTAVVPWARWGRPDGAA
jgi:hypothetical protein